MYGEGNLIRGRYRLERQIAEGGMATVWRAVHTALEAPVAIKFIHGEVEPSQAIVERFLREARVAASVRHRHVVHISDFGLTETGGPFMVMELLEGQTLGERMAAGQVPLAQAVSIMGQVLAGLTAVHDAGIVHRDLKPENVFLVGESDGDGPFVKLLDFGVSRVSHPSERLAQVCPESMVVGTPHYMAPEQARGDREVDARADLYSAGAILYELVTGYPPIDCEDVLELLTKVAAGEHTPLLSLRPDLPRIGALVDRAMSTAPDSRFPNAREMRTALMHAAEARGLGGLSVTDSWRPGALPVATSRAEPLAFTRSPARIDDRPHSHPPITIEAPPESAQGRSYGGLAVAFTTLALLAGGYATMRHLDPEASAERATSGLPDGVENTHAAAATPDWQPEPVWVTEPAPGERKDALAADRDEPRDEPGAAARARSREDATESDRGEAASREESAAVAGDEMEAAAEPETVTVQLDGVPAGARVVVDGTPVDERPLVFPKGSGVRVIEVHQDGFEPITLSHPADVNGVYRVQLVRARATPDPERSARRQRRSRVRARREAAASPSKSEAGVFTDPGF